jgi:hypothetical protein
MYRASADEVPLAGESRRGRINSRPHNTYVHVHASTDTAMDIGPHLYHLRILMGIYTLTQIQPHTQLCTHMYLHICAHYLTYTPTHTPTL